MSLNMTQDTLPDIKSPLPQTIAPDVMATNSAATDCTKCQGEALRHDEGTSSQNRPSAQPIWGVIEAPDVKIFTQGLQALEKS
jgi:hypothetical protein